MAKYAQSFTAADRTNAAIETERLKKHQEVVRFISVETAAVSQMSAPSIACNLTRVTNIHRQQALIAAIRA
jgi:hypothetical protein